MVARGCPHSGISAAKTHFWPATASASKNVLNIPQRVCFRAFSFGFLVSAQNRIFSLETKMRTAPRTSLKNIRYCKWLRGLWIRSSRDDEGQSIMEFMLMLPVLVALVVIMLRINTAIQISIANQQYARSQALFLAFNHAHYPKLSLSSQLGTRGYGQMLIGVSDDAPPEKPGENYRPLAVVQNVARRDPAGGNNAPNQEPLERSLVRVRSTVTLCMPSVSVKGLGGQSTLIVPVAPAGKKFVASGPNALNDQTRFDFCGSPVTYEQ